MPGSSAWTSTFEIEVSVGDDVVLRVKDDGRGFEATSAGSGYGVRNMGARARGLGGQVDVGPAPGGGTERLPAPLHVKR